MKKYSLSFLFVIFVTLVSAQQKEMDKVARAAEAFRLAMIDPDANKLSLLITDSLSYGHSGGHIDHKQEFIDKLVSGKSDFVQINISHQQIQVYKKTAILRHDLEATTNDNGKPGTVKLSVLQVWVKENGQWKLAARQAVHPS
ncbi:MAG: nuclear transport factor 2 family protein [Ferruginibacter sp.]|nr:nuclear transport factor 2 family protein [Ferruginibacter sp.]